MGVVVPARAATPGCRMRHGDMPVLPGERCLDLVPISAALAAAPALGEFE